MGSETLILKLDFAKAFDTARGYHEGVQMLGF
jgi:hypothetical protein